MSPDPWSEFFIRTDERGLNALRDAVDASVSSLAHVPKTPRSTRSIAEIHHAISALEVCPEEGIAFKDVMADLGERVFANGVNPNDAACVAHLHPPALTPAVVSELAVAATNQSMDSWDQSPAATEVELLLMSWLTGVTGLPETGSGVMTSGGTASNVLAITLARSQAGERIGVDVLETGLPLEAARWRILCSDQAHFSVQRAAAQLGLGRDAVLPVSTTAKGAMDPLALDETLAAMCAGGLVPIALVATAGTTDLGAIDPLDELSARARANAMWFHVDAAVAGSFVLSTQLGTRLAGLEHADSVTIDFHKLWWQPFSASALVVRDVGRFDLLRVRSDYLDRGDELAGMVNLVGRSLDTSRRFDAAKVVASLRTLGRANFAQMIEHVVDLAHYAGSAIDAHGLFELLAPVSTVTCVFDAPGFSSDDLRRVQQSLLLRGEMVLGRTIIKGRPALKFTFMNPLSSTKDVDRLIGMVEAEITTDAR